MYQDNLSTIALANRGRSNSSRTRHIAIRYFFAKDRKAAKEIAVGHLGTRHMIADFLSKPLQGSDFLRLRELLLGMVLPPSSTKQQGCADDTV